MIAEISTIPLPSCSAALALFDGAASAHGLPARFRVLLALAENCYAVVRGAALSRPEHLSGDVVVALPVASLSASDRIILACALAFQREKLSTSREQAFRRLDRCDQQATLRMAAILRVAAALGNDPSHPVLVRSGGTGVTVIVAGEHAAAEARAGLWRSEIGPLL